MDLNGFNCESLIVCLLFFLFENYKSCVIINNYVNWTKSFVSVPVILPRNVAWVR